MQVSMARADCSYDDSHNAAPDNTAAPDTTDRNTTSRGPGPGLTGAARQKKGYSSKKQPSFIFKTA